jgi:hypothetical protein
MPVPVFSINAAAEVLERDRRTITKALRHVRPDKKERGQDRWRLATILNALDRLPGSTSAPTRCNSNGLSDDDFATQIFNITEAWTRASDAIVALQEMPDETPEDILKAEGRKAFQKLEALRLAYEAAEPDGKSEASREILVQMFSGLLNACHLVITEDDGKTPLKSFYGEHAATIARKLSQQKQR